MKLNPLLIIPSLAGALLLSGCAVEYSQYPGQGPVYYADSGYYGAPVYYVYRSVPYYYVGGRYFYYNNSRRYYVQSLPYGGSYYHGHGNNYNRNYNNNSNYNYNRNYNSNYNRSSSNNYNSTSYRRTVQNQQSKPQYQQSPGNPKYQQTNQVGQPAQPAGQKSKKWDRKKHPSDQAQ